MVFSRAVVDGIFIEDSPSNLLKNRQFKPRTDLLMGNTADEWAYFAAIFNNFRQPLPMSREDYEAQIQVNPLGRQGYTSRLFLDATNQIYVDWTRADDPTLDYFDTYVAVLTDTGFICSMDQVARAHALAGDSVYYYHYTHYSSVKNSPSWTKAAHTDELQYVFGLAFNSMLPQFAEATDDEKTLAVNVMRYWTNFAKTG